MKMLRAAAIYDDEAKEIDRLLTEKGIKMVRKSDLRSMFGLGSHKATAIYSGLCRIGWVETWSYLEKKI